MSVECRSSVPPKRRHSTGARHWPRSAAKNETLAPESHRSSSDVGGGSCSRLVDGVPDFLGQLWRHRHVVVVLGVRGRLLHDLRFVLALNDLRAARYEFSAAQLLRHGVYPFIFECVWDKPHRSHSAADIRPKIG
jgi:hypothetical protein